MKGDPRIIDLLNECLTGELTAVNQYFLHARMCKNWGYDHLAKKIYEESIDEMKHADKLIERILFLDGLPNLQKLGKLAIGTTSIEILKNDLALEMGDPAAPQHRHPALPRRRRQRLGGPPHAHPRRVRAARGLAGVPAGAGEASRRAALPGPADPRD